MKASEVIVLMPVVFLLGCGQDRPAGESVTGAPVSDRPASAPSEAASNQPNARPQQSKIVVDTWGCKTIDMFESATKAAIDKKPLPQGCFELDTLTRVRGPFDLKTIREYNIDFTYAQIEVTQKGRLWVHRGHIEVFPDWLKPSPPGQALRVTAERLVREYTDAQYLDEQVIVTGIVRFANSQRIEMQPANSIEILDFSSSGFAGIADFPRVRQGQKVTIKGKCLGRGLGDKLRFFFESCSIVPAANKEK